MKEIQPKKKKKLTETRPSLSKLRFPPIHRVKSMLGVVPKVSSIEADRWNAACKA